MALFASIVGLGLATVRLVAAVSIPPEPIDYCPVFYSEAPTGCRPVPESLLNFTGKAPPPQADVGVLEDAFEALAVMQDSFFDSEFGTWPSAIDWTGAVTETVVSGMLTTLTKSLGAEDLADLGDWKAKENLISYYYAHVVDSYFGQDIISLRGQAFDDMLWVVLSWIEALNFVRTHSELHYPQDGDGNYNAAGGLQDALASLPWHGNNWSNSFAHRSRVFWNLASRGWNTTLCHGGMLWNPDVEPYKNAITNELYISASISMYQYFPGDNFTSPWMATRDVASTGFPSNDPAHLQAAVDGYEWLMGVGMMNDQWLFADGFHVDSSIPDNVECDLRDEMVYTYNQAVVLTGQRGLWAVNGNASYLEAGHTLIQSAIAATGWNLEAGAAEAQEPRGSEPLPPWQGLGRGGILEEECDASGTCSQDAQTFKGIFFHHLTAFCAPLDPILAQPGVTVDSDGYSRVQVAHVAACGSYVGWVEHNAMAALETRDDGRFGMWWGASLFDNVIVSEDVDGIDHSADNTTDYRNKGTPDDEIWGGRAGWQPGEGSGSVGDEELLLQARSNARGKTAGARRASGVADEDPNDRGLGRTVETQVGGLAVVRAWWEMSHSDAE